MPEADTLEREAPEEEEDQEDSPPPEADSDDDNQKKSQRPSIRSIRRVGKLGKGFGGGGTAGAGGSAAAGGGAAAGGAAAGGSTAAAAGGGAAIFGGGWIILIVGIVILLIFLIVMIATGGGAGALEQQQNTTNQLKISKTGPADAVKDEVINYQINVTYPGTAQDIEIVDKIPDGTTYEKSDPPAKYDEVTRTATWNLKDHQAAPGAILSNVNIAINLTLKATTENAYLVNQATGSVIGAGIIPPGENGQNFPPTQDNCGGKYKLSNPLGNFGDPQCDFTITKLGEDLKKLDEPNAYKWDRIAECESSYIPNAYASHESIGTPDLAGAWGLFQMGRGKNGEYDHGDVNWSLQISNAINDNYKRVVPAGLPSFRYWQCAGELGYW